VSEDQALIRNCRFAFRCHQQWARLESTPDPRVRHCHECARDVVLCQRDDELREALQADQCVAIQPQQYPADDIHITVGYLKPQGDWTP